ncbi:MAG: ABC transporter substrate-binding protein [Ruminiclostridium sp.]
MKKRILSLSLAAVIAITTLLTGCGTKADADQSATGSTTSTAGTSKPAEPVSIKVAYWASAGGESDAFDALVTKFETANSEIKVIKEGGEFKDFYTKLETRIAGNDAPDVTRLQYQSVGRYSSNGVLRDITKELPADYSTDFLPSLWSAVTYKDAVYAIPQHTDTLAVYYNKNYFEKLGITAPTKLEDAWTWDEFLDISKQLKEKAGAKYGFVYNWTKGNSYRWLPILFQKGGALLSDDLSTSLIDSPEALEALKLSKRFFDEKLVPAGTSVKGTEDINNIFATGTAGMIINGNWLASNYDESMTKYSYGVTYMPRDKAAASDMGGNALAVLKKAKNPEQALKFIQFMTSEESMTYFVTNGGFLPARKSITADKLTYNVKQPEIMKVFIEQATTIPSNMAQAVTSPNMSKITLLLSDELDLLFTQGKDPVEVQKALKKGIDEVLK